MNALIYSTGEALKQDAYVSALDGLVAQGVRIFENVPSPGAFLSPDMNGFAYRQFDAELSWASAPTVSVVHWNFGAGQREASWVARQICLAFMHAGFAVYHPGLRGEPIEVHLHSW